MFTPYRSYSEFCVRLLITNRVLYYYSEHVFVCVCGMCWINQSTLQVHRARRHPINVRVIYVIGSLHFLRLANASTLTLPNFRIIRKSPLISPLWWKYNNCTRSIPSTVIPIGGLRPNLAESLLSDKLYIHIFRPTTHQHHRRDCIYIVEHSADHNYLLPA